VIAGGAGKTEKATFTVERRDDLASDIGEREGLPGLNPVLEPDGLLLVGQELNDGELDSIEFGHRARASKRGTGPHREPKQVFCCLLKRTVLHDCVCLQNAGSGALITEVPHLTFSAMLERTPAHTRGPEGIG